MKEFFTYTDEELMQEIKADNMLAFDILYKKYSKRLYRFAFSILKSNEEAENIIQDVFLNLWENRQKVEKGSSVKYYVFTIAHNSSISLLRKKATSTQFIEYLKLHQNLNQEPVNIEFEYNELRDRLDKIISHLPERQKEVYLLHNIEGLKYREIAKRLSISENTIENHMSRALKNIREKLGKYSIVPLLFFFLFV
jgi:RNA polymerase sigma-70 factor (family 1)